MVKVRPETGQGVIVEHNVVFFRRYPFRVGERVHIEDGPRRGDWEVVSVSERKVGLRCPVTGTRVEWDRFCYLVDERRARWPDDGEKEPADSENT